MPPKAKARPAGVKTAGCEVPPEVGAYERGVADGDGSVDPGRDVGQFTMFARNGVMRALNRKADDLAVTPRSKHAKAYRIVR
jgi:hypothetical protein